MNKNTSRPLFLLSFLLFLFSLRLISALNLNPMPSVDFIPSPGSQPLTNDSDFIRSSCNSTLYPGPLLRLVGRLLQLRPRGSRAAGSCRYRRQLEEGQSHGVLRGQRVAETDAKHLGAAGSSKETLRFLMSNVQTWMSAALTDQETCTDGFDDVADGPVKADVVNRAAYVKKLTSNALALVNSYAEKEMS
ncbi:hypothetical protein Patl1_15487 [Pistacia atlantica]|uniref:Uncharacterized protein n=1 Tax=Pistacia atlantica TaxID=434234 RepID=A0ACC1B5L0_9ROSI|nr:hypothetical protein Patl1_15487 [Pistacia atlantica]